MTDQSQRQTTMYRLSRRRFIGASGAATALALAGCLDGETNDGAEVDEPAPPEPVDDADGVPALPEVENPPEAVYLPTHRESMVMLPVEEVGDYGLLPHFTYPHQFWLVTGDRTELVEPTEPGLHLMFMLWDRETGEMVPVDAGAELEIRQDGAVIDQRVPWPMLSQEMGFHFGDNVPLPEDGTYEVEVTIPPVDVRKTGAFEGRLAERVSTTFEFELTQERREEMVAGIEYLDESEWGEPGALEPMGHGGHDHGDHGEHEDDHGDQEHADEHDHDDGGEHSDGHEPADEHDHEHGDKHGGHGDIPTGMLPPAAEYPGTAVGEPTSGDAIFVVRYLEDSPLAEPGEGYLFVSPRTPYNRYPLPDMALSVEGDVEGSLEQTLDDALGLHYGLSVSLDSGDSFDLVVDSPPQVSRHQGYETAFLDMPPMSLDVGE